MEKTKNCVAAQKMEPAWVKGDFEETLDNIRLVDTATLQKVLSCCRTTAIKIGMEAGARIQIGTAVRWKVSRISEYLENQCEGGRL